MNLVAVGSECAASCGSTGPEPCVRDEWDGQYQFCLFFCVRMRNKKQPTITSFNQPHAGGFTHSYVDFFFRFKIQMCAGMHTVTHNHHSGHDQDVKRKELPEVSSDKRL